MTMKATEFMATLSCTSAHRNPGAVKVDHFSAVNRQAAVVANLEDRMKAVALCLDMAREELARLQAARDAAEVR
jgi:hypothetical protein